MNVSSGVISGGICASQQSVQTRRCSGYAGSGWSSWSAARKLSHGGVAPRSTTLASVAEPQSRHRVITYCPPLDARVPGSVRPTRDRGAVLLHQALQADGRAEALLVTAPGRLAHLPVAGRFGRDPAQAGRERGGLARPVQQPRHPVLDEFDEGAVTGGDGRDPRRHRLHDHQAERLQPGRGSHHGDRPRDGLPALRRVVQADVARTSSRPAAQAVTSRSSGPVPAITSGTPHTAARGDLVPRGHEQPHALGLREPAEIEQMLAGARPAGARLGHEVVLHRQPLGRHAGRTRTSRCAAEMQKNRSTPDHHRRRLTDRLTASGTVASRELR